MFVSVVHFTDSNVVFLGNAVALLVEAHVTSQKIAGSIPDAIVIFN
jgi:hypothetical protein